MEKFVLFLLFSLIPFRMPQGNPAGLKEVGRLIDRIYWQQSCGSKCSEYISGIEEGKIRKLFTINFGPFNRFTGESLIEGVRANPGQGNYPEGIEAEALKEFLEKHPELEEEIKSPYTVIVKDGETFRAVPFSERFSEELKEISKILSALNTGNYLLDEYLHVRSKELLVNEYEEGDALWFKIEDGISAYIGPCVVEDPVLGVKRAYGEVVFDINKEWTQWGKKIITLLPELQKRLPLEELRNTRAGEYPALQVADLKFAAGVFKAPPAVNFVVLPPYYQNGAKKVFFKNVIFLKYKNALSKIGERFIAGWKPDRDGWLSFLVLHDVFHYLGGFLTSSGEIPWEKLGSKKYYLLEEIKADTIPVYFAEFLAKRGIITKDVDTFRKNYLAHLFYYAAKNRKAAVVELNYLLIEGGIRLKNGGKIEVLNNFKNALGNMLKEVLKAELTGERSELFSLKKLSFGLEDAIKEHLNFEFYMENNVR